ncbi:MAG: hypothetical protein ACT4QE_00975 [Anaerolineales bacterium]
MSRNTQIGIGICAALVLIGCCCALAFAGVGGLFFFQATRNVDLLPLPTDFITLVPPATRTPAPTRTPLPPGIQTPTPVASDDDTLADLQSANIQPRDLGDLARQLDGVTAFPTPADYGNADHALGTELDFNVSNEDTQEAFTVRARLIAKTENVYFFAENGVGVEAGEAQDLIDDFQQNAYVTNREFFGSEPNPGIDGDPRLYILYVRGLGFGILGYFNSEDAYPRWTNARSNEKEMFYINADLTQPDDRDLRYTLAHEFQHMIHWGRDVNEEVWISEGASVLAQLLNGDPTPGYDEAFIENPETQLNTWPSAEPEHYGAGFLFLAYFLDQFGEAATQELIAEPRNGLDGVDAVLARVAGGDPPLTAYEVFADWVVTNYLNDPNAVEGRYAYARLGDLQTVAPTDEITDCPTDPITASVPQFAAHYYVIDCAGDYALTFEGAAEVLVLDTTPYSGRYMFWGHRADESVTSLTRAFDFGSLSTATLNYAAWWDIEDGYDYAYVQISADEGQTWQTLRATSTTDDDPTGANYGWGYTDKSNGWSEESVDLSEFAGQRVLVRFQSITDAALVEPGFAVDDVAIPELSYNEDFETDDGGWQAEGFVRIDNTLTQQFIVQLIRQGVSTTVERVPLDADNRARFSLNPTANETVTLVISGVTRFNTQPAEYSLALEQD